MTRGALGAALVALAAAGGCEKLPPFVLGVCGNGVLEPGEACDRGGDPTCGSADDPLPAARCQLRCAADATGCADGLGVCGPDLVCRTPSGLFVELAGSPVAEPAGGAPAGGDLDGDGRFDLAFVGLGQGDALLLRDPGGPSPSLSRVAVDRTSSLPLVALSLNDDRLADLLIPSSRGLQALIGVAAAPPVSILPIGAAVAAKQETFDFGAFAYRAPDAVTSELWVRQADELVRVSLDGIGATVLETLALPGFPGPDGPPSPHPAVIDLDLDGLLDLVVAYPGAAELSVLHASTGLDGGLELTPAAIPLPAPLARGALPGGGQDVAAGLLEPGQAPALAVTLEDGRDALLVPSGALTYAADLDRAAGACGAAGGGVAAIVDLDADGRGDLLCSTGAVALQRGAAFRPGHRPQVSYERVIVADLNRDGAPDVAGVIGELLGVAVNVGDGTFAETLTALSEVATDLVAVDLDGDRFPELVVRNGLDFDGRLRVLPGTISGVPGDDVAEVASAVPIATVAAGSFDPRDERLDAAAVQIADGLHVALLAGDARRFVSQPILVPPSGDGLVTIGALPGALADRSALALVERAGDGLTLRVIDDLLASPAERLRTTLPVSGLPAAARLAGVVRAMSFARGGGADVAVVLYHGLAGGEGAAPIGPSVAWAATSPGSAIAPGLLDLGLGAPDGPPGLALFDLDGDGLEDLLVSHPGEPAGGGSAPRALAGGGLLVLGGRGDRLEPLATLEARGAGGVAVVGRAGLGPAFVVVSTRDGLRVAPSGGLAVPGALRVLARESDGDTVAGAGALLAVDLDGDRLEDLVVQQGGRLRLLRQLEAAAAPRADAFRPAPLELLPLAAAPRGR